MPAENSILPQNRSDEFRSQRLQMVDVQLRRRGICDQRVLDAMSRVPRHEFVPAASKKLAYVDHAMSIGCGQTISQPLIVAFMCEAAELVGRERVLEVGTGSGYGAAVLSELADQVHTVECISELAEDARRRLARLGYKNISVHTANGALGWSESGPFDAIIVTAGAETLPKAYLNQLASGGRIIIPIGDSRYGQTMYRITLDGAKPVFEEFGGCAFVPLVGDYRRENKRSP